MAFSENQKVKLNIPNERGVYLTGRFKHLISGGWFAEVVFDHKKSAPGKLQEPTSVPIDMLEPG
jgi:hypothetical protein